MQLGPGGGGGGGGGGGCAGLLPISSLCESRYSGLYRDTRCAWPGKLGHDAVGLGHDTVLAATTIWPRVGKSRPAAR